MSLHIQMSEEAEAELKKSARRNKLSSLAASLLFCGGGGLALWGAVILIEQAPMPNFLAYVPPAIDAPPTNQPTTQELTSKASSPSNDVSPSVIVATGAAPVQMAAVEIEAASIEIGGGIDVGMGFGTGGLGDGLGDGGSGLGSGKAGGSTLTGTFYDLKLTRSGAKTELYPTGGSNIPNDKKHVLIGIYHEFTKGWNASVLNKYYKSPTQLYASNFYMPNCDAGYGPYAYQCDPKKVKPSAWVAVYRGNVRAPKSGKFRFVGTGDDLLCIRFNKKTVLEAGWSIPSKHKEGSAYALDLSFGNSNGQAYKKGIESKTDPDHKDYEYVPLPSGWTWNQVGGLTAGTIFEVQEGKTYPIEIMVSEGPGGRFGFAVLIEDINDNPQGKKPAADRVYDIFRTNFSLPNEADLKKLMSDAGFPSGGLQCPKYNEDSPIWVAVP